MTAQSSDAMQMSDALAIVIPYFRGREFIESCISSILQSTRVPDYICIVDNDPEGVQEDSWLHRHAPVHIVRSKVGIGFGRASNIGVYWAISRGCQLFIVLNQDTILEEMCIAKLVSARQTLPDLSIVSAIPTAYGGDVISRHYRQHILEKIETFISDESSGVLADVYESPRMFAVCILLDLSTINRLGLFDPVFYMYGEDDDLALRTQRSGGKLFLCPSASVQHRHTLEYSEEKTIIAEYQLRSRLILRIRYDGINRLQFAVRCVGLFFYRLFGSKKIGKLRPDVYLSTLVLHLKDWRTIKSIEPGQLLKRIENQIQDDL
jgi:GT2 family glycosyltransferase